MRASVEEAERKRLFGSREGLNPDEYIFIRYRFTPASGLSIEEAAARALMVTTLRTMRRLTYETTKGRLETGGRITSHDTAGHVEFAVPLSQCSEMEGLTHLILLITAAAEYNYTDTFWVESIELPRAFVQRYKGPRFGVSGVRSLFRVRGRPLIGLVIKPRASVSLGKIIEICGEALRGGVDFLVDDLLMVDPKGDMRFQSRVARLGELVAQASSSLGEKKLYFANVGVSAHKAVDLARKAIDAGCGGVLANAFTMGIGGVEHLVEEIGGKLPVICTNMGSGIMSRGSWLGSSPISPTGMSEAVIAKLSRVAGADAVHTGTSASECYGEEAWGPASRSLAQDLHDIRPSMAVAEGDLTVANLWDNISSLGTDLLIESTSGIINYPAGAARGAEAFRLLVDLLNPEMSAEAAHEAIAGVANKVRHLGDALRYFGYTPEAKK